MESDNGDGRMLWVYQAGKINGPNTSGHLVPCWMEFKQAVLRISAVWHVPLPWRWGWLEATAGFWGIAENRNEPCDISWHSFHKFVYYVPRPTRKIAVKK